MQHIHDYTAFLP